MSLWDSLIVSQVGEGLVKDWNQARVSLFRSFGCTWNCQSLNLQQSTPLNWQTQRAMQGPLFQTCCSCIWHFSGMVCTCVINVSTLAISRTHFPAEPSRARSHEGGQARWHHHSPFDAHLFTKWATQELQKWNGMMIINEHIMYICCFHPVHKDAKHVWGALPSLPEKAELTKKGTWRRIPLRVAICTRTVEESCTVCCRL